jgi:hypothetical protein
MSYNRKKSRGTAIEIYRIGCNTNRVTLKHVQKRLSVYKFEPEIVAFLELETLITAFVVTYVRLHHGGQQSGSSRDNLPEMLRSIHDEMIDLRNKRLLTTMRTNAIEAVDDF